ncbi:MAG: F0F1 ATP synthase subunit A [Chloroflexi bacterium]|nr:F0F1 ATP synthase subunit A [Chloroflexota bacterium]
MNRTRALLVLIVILLLAGPLIIHVPSPEILLPAEKVAEPFKGFRLTNTVLATWLTMSVLALLSWGATRNLKLVPGRLQNLLEMAVEALWNFVESVAGRHNGRRFFPLIATIFLFIVISAWLALLPGFATIGGVKSADEVVHEVKVEAQKDNKTPNLESAKMLVFNGTGAAVVIPPRGSKEDKEITAAEYEKHGAPAGKTAGSLVPFLRSANTDLNTTLAMALIAMFMVEFWGIRTAGFFKYARRFVNVRQLMRGNIMWGLIDAFVGALEGVGEIARVISFTFRLFGNMFAGEILLLVIVSLLPFVVVLPFVALEIFVGFVQALVFAGLTLVFATMAVASHGDHDESPEHAAGH